MILTFLVVAHLHAYSCKWIAPLQPQYAYCTNGTTETTLHYTKPLVVAQLSEPADVVATLHWTKPTIVKTWN